MKKFKRGVISLIAAIALIVTMLPAASVSAVTLPDKLMLSEITSSITDMTENTKYQSTLKNADDVHWYKLNPSESCTYCFFACNKPNVQVPKIEVYYITSIGKLIRENVKSGDGMRCAGDNTFRGSINLQKGITYYVAIHQIESVADPSGLPYSFFVKKASNIASAKATAIHKYPLLQYNNQVGSYVSYIDSNFRVDVTLEDGTTDIVVGNFNKFANGGSADADGYIKVGGATGDVVHGDIYIKQGDYQALKNGVAGIYTASIRLYPRALTNNIYSIDAQFEAVAASSVYGETFKDINGAKLLNPSICGYRTYYSTAISVEKDGMYSVDFGTGLNNYSYVIYSIDDSGRCTGINRLYSDSGSNNILKLKKGKYYMDIHNTSYIDYRYATFGEPVGVSNTQSISLAASGSVAVGDKLHMTDDLVLTPADSTDVLIWSSDNTAVAEVTSDGVVKGIAPGTATIKVVSGDYSATCLVTVVPATSAKNASTSATGASTSASTKTDSTGADTGLKRQSIKIKKKTLSVKRGKTIKLTSNVTCLDKAKLSFKKISGNKNITISSSGKLTAKKGIKKGTYKVKLQVSAQKTNNYAAGSLTKEIKIKVK